MVAPIVSALVYYVVPGLLGRAFDVKNNTVGPDLFHADNVEKHLKIKSHSFSSEYKLVSELSEATDFLDVGGKLALKIKTGAIDIKGSGDYLKDTTSFKNKVELLVKVRYETVIEVLPSDVDPIPNWYKNVEGTDNTHYIRAILYGGELIASVSFLAKSNVDKETIKATIEGEMSTKSGSFSGEIKGKLDKLKEDIKESASMSINYYATVPLTHIARDIEGLNKLVKEFPNHTMEVNDGKGVPLQMEVFSLASLKQDYVPYYQTLALADSLSEIDEQLTDFRSARRKLGDWVKTIPPVLPETENERIGSFATTLDNLNRVYSSVISQLDTSANGSLEQLDPAFEEYQKFHGYYYPDKYVREMSELKRKVLDNSPSLEADYGGDIYTHWGSEECPNDAVTMLHGTMTGTNKMDVGTAIFGCLPEEKEFFPDEKDEIDSNLYKYPNVQPVVFSTRRSGKMSKINMAVKCAKCRVSGKSSTAMLPGFSKCPEKWRTEYGGVLVSTDEDMQQGELICLDVSKRFKEDKHSEDTFTVITEVSPKCDDFPCMSGGGKAISCVVCSIKKG